MYVADLINEFLEHLEVESGRSKKTVDNYRLYLERFLEIAQEILNKNDVEAKDITKELLRKYRLKLNRYGSENGGDDLKTITQAYYLIALRGFLKYLSRREIKSLDPSLVELPRVVRKQVTFLHFDEVEDMLEEIDLSTESGLRDRAIIELLYSGGLRVSELVGLNRDSINLDRREFMVRGKGSKDRPIFISETCADRVRDYLDARTDSLPAEFLFASQRIAVAARVLRRIVASDPPDKHAPEKGRLFALHCFLPVPYSTASVFCSICVSPAYTV